MVNSVAFRNIADIEFVGKSVGINSSPSTAIMLYCKNAVTAFGFCAIPNPAAFGHNKLAFKAGFNILWLSTFHTITIPPLTMNVKYIGKYLMADIERGRVVNHTPDL